MNRIWRNASLFAVLVFMGTLVYAYAYHGRFSSFVVIQALGIASVLVIAPSLALSGLAYYANFADHLLVYRKSVGLMGFYLGLIHVGLSMLESGILLRGLGLTNLRDGAIIAGYGAVVLFALMPLVVHRTSVSRLGAKRVRLGLRYLGYGAYALVLFHAVILSLRGWRRWFDTFDPLLPPPTLVACAIGFAVLALRFALFLSNLRDRYRTEDRATT